MLGSRPSLRVFSVSEGMLVYCKVIVVAALVFGSPWLLWQLWAFVAAGLYPHEKRLVNVYLPISLALFLGGVLLCQFLVIPKAIEAMLWFDEWLGFEPELRLSEWLSFALMMPLVFGLSFQTPLLMLFLNRIGLIDEALFRQKRSVAWFILAIFAGVVTPSTDAFSMFYLWLPLGILFELGIWLCALRHRASVESPA